MENFRTRANIETITSDEQRQNKIIKNVTLDQK